MKQKPPKRTRVANAVWRVHRELWEASGKKRIPSYMEVAAAAHIPPSSVQYGYERLRVLGIATRKPGAWRTWYVKPYREQ